MTVFIINLAYGDLCSVKVVAILYYDLIKSGVQFKASPLTKFFQLSDLTAVDDTDADVKDW